MLGLALGLGSAIAYVKRPQNRGPLGDETSAPLSSSPVVASGTANAGQKPAAAAKSGKAMTGPFTWRQIESEDYPQYIVNLRSVGCPEQTIRDMIIADVNKLYAARETPLKRKGTNQVVQVAGQEVTVPTDELERLRQLRELQLEKRQVIKQLLGIDIPLDMLPSSGSRDYSAYEVAFRFLPAEKRDAAQTLQENYWQQSDALKAKYNNKRPPEFLEESRQLTDSLRQEMAKILTTQELEDFDIRTSATAKKLSTQLASTFLPTEEEFRQIFRATRAFEETNARLSETVRTAPAVQPGQGADPIRERTAALNKERAVASGQMNDALKATLGDDRFAQYQHAQDSDYELLTRLGTRYGLSKEAVSQAYDLRKQFQAQPKGGDDPNVPPSNRAELNRQLNEQLTTVLGETAARGLRRVRPETVSAGGD